MKIQLKRSNQLVGDNAKPPTAAQMEYGEIAVNYNEQDPVLFIKDRTDQIIRIAGKGSEGSFTGDYNDLINTPTIGDGTITINNSDGSENATFTVNQTGDTEVTLPAGFSGSWDDLTDIPDSITGDYNDLENKPGLQEVTDVGSNTTNGITIDTDKIALNANGSSTFAGRVTVGTNRTDAIGLYAEGTSTAANIPVIRSQSFGDGGAVFAGFDKDGNDRVSIMSDGSATFKGTINGNGNVGYQGNEIRVFNDYLSGTTGNGGIHLSYTGTDKASMITAGSNNTTAPSLKFAFVLGGEDPKANGRTPIQFNYDGSATFDGKVQAAGYRIDQLDPIAADSP